MQLIIWETSTTTRNSEMSGVGSILHTTRRLLATTFLPCYLPITDTIDLAKCVCVDYHRGGLYISIALSFFFFSLFLFFFFGGGEEEEVSIHWHFPDFHCHFSLEWGAKGANLSPVSIIPFVLMRVLFLFSLFLCPIIPLIVLLCSTLFCHFLREGPFHLRLFVLGILVYSN